MNKKIVHDALVLFAFTVVLGLILGVVYGITKPSIDQVNYEKTQAAYKQVFEDAASFEEYSDFDADAAAALMTEKGFSDQIDSVNTALDASGNVIGYVLTVTAKDASQASITFSVGIQNDGTVNGYSITNIAETPGLGMKAQEEAFYSQFEGKNVDSFTVVKAAPASDNEIESISGATITSKAMANGVNACIAYPQEEDPYLTKDSVLFHEKFGYSMVGKFHACGYKFNRWYDMVWMEKMIGEHLEKQPPIVPFSEIEHTLDADIK